MASKFWRTLSSKRSTALAIPVLLSRLLGTRRLGLRPARPNGHVMQENAYHAKQSDRSQNRFKQPLPHRIAPGDLRILGQTAIALGIGGVVEHIDDVRAADGLRIVDAGFVQAELVAQLRSALFGDELHIVLGAELQTAGRAGLDARRLQPRAHAVGTERALINSLGQGIELWNIERASGDAELTADAVLLVEVHNAVRILDDGAVGRTRGQTAGIGAVHALLLAHQPLDRPIRLRVFVELDQVPEVPARFPHGLVGVVKSGRREWQVIPLDTRYFAGLAADADGRIHQFADFQIPLHTVARNRPGMGRDHFGL